VWYFVVFLWMLELSWQCDILLFFNKILELSWQCGISLFFMDVGTVLTVWYFVVFKSYWKTTKYHTVRTIPTSTKKQQNTTLSEQFQ
jgi:hypothetical protein